MASGDGTGVAGDGGAGGAGVVVVLCTGTAAVVVACKRRLVARTSPAMYHMANAHITEGLVRPTLRIRIFDRGVRGERKD